MRVILITLFFFPYFLSAKTLQEKYQQAFDSLVCMLNETCSGSFKEAVFLVEDAYTDKALSKEDFEKQISFFASTTDGVMFSQKLQYEHPDSGKVKQQAALFTVMADTIFFSQNGKIGFIPPFTYDFDDPWGLENWENMFVSKLLDTKKGNCHSLPLLYLILADEIGAEASLSVAPKHTYIKFRDDDGKWHNVELTSGMITTDMHLFQAGFIRAEAIQNKVYLQPLTQSQMLSHRFSDLANGYIKQYCYNEFVYRIVEKALEIDPLNMSAQAIKSNFLTENYKHVEAELGINRNNFREKFKAYPLAKRVFLARNYQYQIIDELGYAEMPEEAYERWIRRMKKKAWEQESKRRLKSLDLILEQNREKQKP